MANADNHSLCLGMVAPFQAPYDFAYNHEMHRSMIKPAIERRGGGGAADAQSTRTSPGRKRSMVKSPYGPDGTSPTQQRFLGGRRALMFASRDA